MNHTLCIRALLLPFALLILGCSASISPSTTTELVENTPFPAELLCPNERGIIEGDRGSMFYQIIGSGAQDIVWVHGMPLNGEAWLAQVKHFSPGYRNIVVDLRGYFRSSKLPDSVDRITDLYVSDLKNLFQRLNLERPVLVGFASGGHGTLKFAAQYPNDISKLVIINSSPYFSKAENWQGFSRNSLTEFISQIEKTENSQRIAEILFESAIPEQCGKDLELLKQWYESMIPLAGKQTILGFFQNIAHDDSRNLLSQITAPTLIIRGALGEEVPSSTSLFMRSKIPDSRLVEVDGIGHFAYATQYQLINDIIEQFISPRCVVAIPSKLATTPCPSL